MAIPSQAAWQQAVSVMATYIDGAFRHSAEPGHFLAMGGGVLMGVLFCVAATTVVLMLLRLPHGNPLSVYMAMDGANARGGDTPSALQDALTGLPGRLALERRLQYPDRGAGRFAVLVMGMDSFRAVNEVHDHTFGDALLGAVAKRIRAYVRADDLVVRLAGDEFAVLTCVEEPSQTQTMAKRLLQRMQAPFNVLEQDVDITASIGIAVDSAAGTQRNRLLGQASAALCDAKEQGRNRYSVFDASMGASSAEIELMVGDLRKALRDDELALLYQPKLDLQKGRIVGVEALLRWNHPLHGPISPDYFIPLAEKTGMIVEIGRWVLNEACRQMRLWRDERTVDWNVAVNASVFQINSPTFFSDICDALERYDIDPQDLAIEVTESGAMRNAELTLMMLRKLASLGVQVSLDDFGVGYSSLSHLKRFPLHELKIDRSFISGITDNAEDLAIVNAIIALAKAVGLYVVAEGVETVEQQAVLVEMECDSIQGYLISRPVEADEISRVVSRYNHTRQAFDGFAAG